MHGGDGAGAADLETVHPRHHEGGASLGGFDGVPPAGDGDGRLEEHDERDAREDEGAAAELVDNVGADEREDEVEAG